MEVELKAGQTYTLIVQSYGNESVGFILDFQSYGDNGEEEPEYDDEGKVEEKPVYPEEEGKK